MLQAALLLAAAMASPEGAVVYRVELARAGLTSVAVSLELPSEAAAPVTLVIPRAVPMGYSQQEYDRYVSDVRAFGSRGEALTVEREEGPRFRVGAAGASVRRVAYRVDLARMEREILSASDASRARPGYVGLLGYSVFGYLEGWQARPARLEAAAPSDWPVFTTLAPAAPPALGHATGDAADFYALADSQLATLSMLSIELDPMSHRNTLITGTFRSAHAEPDRPSGTSAAAPKSDLLVNFIV